MDNLIDLMSIRRIENIYNTLCSLRVEWDGESKWLMKVFPGDGEGVCIVDQPRKKVN